MPQIEPERSQDSEVGIRNIREIRRFFLTGCAAVTTDLAIYYLLSSFCSYEVSKGLSFLCGALVAYLLNKFWTFQRFPLCWGEISAFVLLYTASLGLNVTVNHYALDYLPWIGAFLLATSTSTVVNFFGQKYGVFRKSSESRLLNPES